MLFSSHLILVVRMVRYQVKHPFSHDGRWELDVFGDLFIQACMSTKDDVGGRMPDRVLRQFSSMAQSQKEFHGLSFCFILVKSLFCAGSVILARLQIRPCPTHPSITA